MKPEFHLFDWDHLVALLLVAIFSALAFRAAQGSWATGLNRFGGVVFALFAAALWLFRLGDGFQAGQDLPLWLCDIAFLLCVACFIKPTSLLLTLVTYWGLAGTLQALITPDLPYGFPSREFMLFFTGHAIIVVCVFFLLGKNKPPRLASAYGVGVAYAGLLVYTLVVGGLDSAFGWNYGYLRAKPQGKSVLDAMGDWPVYIFAGLGLALLLFVAVAGLLRLLWNLLPGGQESK